ncbi:MAG: nascent polypeptide-associated complex protein [Nanoarchaeota archaeon]|nr:nascent polypeptide-associated complex protein [Nanoarchaeota archaeon]MBU0978102.1 nascent polypeptide-associated complex protein [Nanoarchaeota archaeon]
MFPGLGGMNPAKMKGMMKQLGINQEEIDAEKVTIEKTDGSKIVIENPSVQKITMQGQSSFQVAGNIVEQSAEAFSEDDVKLVAEKTSHSLEKARAALEETKGDIAEAIMKLSD